MDKYLRACFESALAGGNEIADFKSTIVAVKANEYVGDARVTNADYKSQEAVLKEIMVRDEDPYFITEEHVKNPDFRRRVLGANVESMRECGVYIIDELDGTPSHNSGHHEWSVSVGYAHRMDHVAGAVYAPKISGGMMFFASKNYGAYTMEKGRKPVRREVSKQTDPRKSQVLVGIDCATQKYPMHNKLMTESGRNFQWVKTTGSCALGLGLVAAGWQDALVQPLQSCWDWSGGKPAVEGAGGVMIFYEMDRDEDGTYRSIRPVENLEPRHYDPQKRTIGFVAANEKLAEDIMDMLLSIR